MPDQFDCFSVQLVAGRFSFCDKFFFDQCHIVLPCGTTLENLLSLASQRERPRCDERSTDRFVAAQAAANRGRYRRSPLPPRPHPLPPLVAISRGSLRRRSNARRNRSNYLSVSTSAATALAG